MNYKNIHTFGDSHSWFAWKDLILQNVNVKINHLGPHLMYSFGKHKHWIFRNIKYRKEKLFAFVWRN